jgi:hypothetical protein
VNWYAIICFWLAGSLGAYTGIEGINNLNRRKRIILWCLTLMALTAGTELAIRQQHEQDQQYKQLLQSMTGGDSFPVIVPQSQAPNIRLVLWNFGAAALTGVVAKMRCKVEEAPHIETVGTVPAHGSEELTTVLVLTPCADTNTIKGENVATYMLEISAQNGNYYEMLQFKKSKTCDNYWSNRYMVNKGPGVGITGNNPKPQILLDEQKQLYSVPNDPKTWPTGWVGRAECL